MISETDLAARSQEAREEGSPETHHDVGVVALFDELEAKEFPGTLARHDDGLRADVAVDDLARGVQEEQSLRQLEHPVAHLEVQELVGAHVGRDVLRQPILQGSDHVGQGSQDGFRREGQGVMRLLSSMDEGEDARVTEAIQLLRRDSQDLGHRFLPLRLV